MARFTLKPFPNASGVVDQKELAIVCLATRFQFIRRVLRPGLFLMMLLLTHLFSESGAAQGRIIVMEKDLRPARLPTSEVTWIPGATRKAEPVGKVPLNLSIGDELIGNTGAVRVKVRCNNTTDLVLSGRFDVRFLRAKEEGSCNLYYERKARSAINVDAGGPTEIQTGKSGEIRLGSRRTRYEVRTSVDQSDVSPEVLVFENEVFVESSVFSGTVKAGKQLVGEDSDRLIKKLSSTDYREAAESEAKLDTSQAFRMAPDPPTQSELESAFKELLSRHQAVLEHPRDSTRLAALEKTRVKLETLPDRPRNDPYTYSASSAPYRKAAKASDDIAAAINTMVRIKRELGTSGKLSRDREITLTNLLQKANTADRAFVNEIKKLKADPNPATKAALCSLFNAVTSALTDLNNNGILPIEDADAKSKLTTVFSTITAASSIVAGAGLC